MVSRNITRTRNTAATLLTLSGLSHIAELWFRDISDSALTGALFGSLCLIIGIGLYGQSRFTLFMAIVVPAVGVRLALINTDTAALNLLPRVQLGAEVSVMIFSAIVLFAVRNNPSV